MLNRQLWSQLELYLVCQPAAWRFFIWTNDYFQTYISFWWRAFELLSAKMFRDLYTELICGHRFFRPDDYQYVPVLLLRVHRIQDQIPPRHRHTYILLQDGNPPGPQGATWRSLIPRTTSNRPASSQSTMHH